MAKLPFKSENPEGLYGKYIIEKVNGNKIDRDAEYFILRLDSGGSDTKHFSACRKAIMTYADEIKDHLPKLSKDLIQKYG